MPAGGEEQIGVGGREGGGERELERGRGREIELNGLGGGGGWELVIKLN